MKNIQYTIRTLHPSEYGLLADFLYEAIFIPEGVEPPPREIIEQPELQLYIEDFGSGAADYALAAEAEGRIVGAVWTRIMDDYGHIDDQTPSFAIALYREYRGCGIGTELMKKMLTLLRREGYRQASLAVQKANYAVGMYRKVGFAVIDENEEEYIMVCKLAGARPNAEVKLVRASVQDAERIWKMQVRAFAGLLENYRDTDTNPGSEPLEKVVARLEQDFTYFYFIECGGETVGAIRVVVLPEGIKHISPIFVLPEHQGRGIAQAAMLAAEEIHGSHNWELSTIKQEPKNCHLYEKMGYRRQDREMVINERLTLVFYEKP